MHYMVYISAAAYLMGEEDLKEILEVSRTNNTGRDVTGLLLYHDGNFIQVLEGDKEVVRELYDKISIDNRHAYLHKMLEGTLNQRNFPDWSMGFKGLTSAEFRELNGYRELDREAYLAPTTGNKDHPVMTLIKSFVDVNVREWQGQSHPDT